MKAELDQNFYVWKFKGIKVGAYEIYILTLSDNKRIVNELRRIKTNGRYQSENLKAQLPDIAFIPIHYVTKNNILAIQK